LAQDGSADDGQQGWHQRLLSLATGQQSAHKHAAQHGVGKSEFPSYSTPSSKT
jgi:hypothetical protein